MDPLPFLTRRRTLVIALGVAGAFIVFSSTLPRVIALELAFTGGEFRRALADWISTFNASAPRVVAWLGPIHALQLATLADFLFIPAYTVLLAIAYVRLRGFRRDPPAPQRLDSIDVIVLTAAAAAA